MTDTRDRFHIALSDIDFQRHGHVTAKALVTDSQELTEAIAFCARHSAELLILRCPTSAYALVREVSKMGMQLLDTLVYYERNLEKNPPSPAEATVHHIREATPADEERLLAFTHEGFASYPGHYYLDPRIGPAISQEIYVDWARRLCADRTGKTRVMVVEMDGAPAGYLAYRFEEEAVEIFLSAIDTTHKRKGIFQNLTLDAVHRAYAAKKRRIFVSTQIPNLVSQRAWIHCGFMLNRSYYTFHHWLR